MEEGWTFFEEEYKKRPSDLQKGRYEALKVIIVTLVMSRSNNLKTCYILVTCTLLLVTTDGWLIGDHAKYKEIDFTRGRLQDCRAVGTSSWRHVIGFIFLMYIGVSSKPLAMSRTPFNSGRITATKIIQLKTGARYKKITLNNLMQNAKTRLDTNFQLNCLKNDQVL